MTDGGDRRTGTPMSDNGIDLRPIPRIAIQAFCESPDVAAVLEQASGDRRMAKTHVKIHMGGIAAATDFYSSAPTPNLLLVESREKREQVLEQINRLAGVCDPGTKVILIGHTNDVVLYRELLRRGVSDYMVVPFDLYDVIREIGELYLGNESTPVGRTIAFIGAKGGAGSSTVAHNVAFALSRSYEADVVVADLDLAWGTAGLDFNQDPPQTVADAIQAPDRIDDVFLDRILAKCADNLSLLAAPAALERAYDHDEHTFDLLVDVIRGSVPSVVIDLPHQWTAWVRRVLSLVDDVVITATPDLASLRNTKNLVDQLKIMRPNDREAKIVVNQIGVPKRPEIKPDDFRKALGIDLLATVPFDPALFGAAANNGQMIAEINAKSPVAETFADIARRVMGRAEVRKAKKSALAPLLAKLTKGRSKAG
ncbi:septum site-determining protein MinD [Pleomorphomonas sp. SM30]|uniref:Pilus assembly protein CpaE n=2 Tax=Oharaeibacter diazotrophicus TaxID=1920512 RepID=A0A4R6RDG0_9HYPH|nr:pilus assembly protein CpaE [Oharaeibacter diazotrophicus]BBE73173.1 septum site-determining protein MinD [Pleomorphomonas sp. SM30]